MVINKDFWSALFFLIASITLWIIIPSQVPLNNASDSFINAQFMPKFVTICLIILSVFLLVKTVVKRKKTSEKTFTDINLKKELRVLIMFGILVLYAVLIPFIGFLISSLLMSVGMFVLFEVKNWKYHVAVVVSILAVYFLFTSLLSIGLP